MKKKIIVSILVIVFFILAIALLINANENTNEILVKKITYEEGSIRRVIKINKNGAIYKSEIIDELTLKGAPKDKFSKAGTISKEDLITIENIINEMKEEPKKNSNYSENYGIFVNLGEELYRCEYFSQENVDKLNGIIQKYEKKQY